MRTPPNLGITIDGYVFPRKPADVFKAGDAHRVDLVLGSNAHEIVPGSIPPADVAAAINAAYGPRTSRARALYRRRIRSMARRRNSGPRTRRSDAAPGARGRSGLSVVAQRYDRVDAHGLTQGQQAAHESDREQERGSERQGQRVVRRNADEL